MESESGPRRPHRQILQALLFLWIPVVVAAYYVIHKPWSESPSIEILWPLLDLILAAALLLLAAGVGHWALDSRLGGLDPLEQAAVQAALGLGSLGLTVLGVGLLGILHAPLLWLMLLIGLALFGRRSLRWLRKLRALTAGWADWGTVAWSACGLVLALLAISLGKALTPPTAWDTLVYHLELPKQYLASARVGFNPNNLFVGFPQLAEMIFTWAMALRSGSTAAVAGWLAGVLGLVGALGFARRIVGEQLGWLSAALILTGGSLWQGLSWAYVDHWVLLFGAVVFIMLDHYARLADRYLLVVAGIAAGCALGTKYTGGLVAVGGALYLLYLHIFQRDSRAARGGAENVAGGQVRPQSLGRVLARNRIAPLARDWLILGGLTALVALPWLLRNAIQMDNPVYPMLFSGKQVDSLRQMYQAQQAPDRGLVDALLLPWQATVQGIEGGPGFNTSIGPLLLALIPGVVLGVGSLDSAARRSIHRLAVLAAGVWLLWALGAQFVAPLTRSRHYYGFLPALAVLAAAGYRGMRSLEIGSLNVGWILSRFVIFVFTLTAVSALLYLGRTSPVRVLTRGVSHQAYLEEQLGWYARVMERLNRLPDGSKVRFLWEPRAYYCRVDCVPDAILDQWWYLAQTIQPSELAAVWKAQGVTHVLIYDLGIELEKSTQPLLTDAHWRALDQFRTEELSLIEEFGDRVYSLYELH